MEKKTVVFDGMDLKWESTSRTYACPRRVSSTLGADCVSVLLTCDRKILE